MSLDLGEPSEYRRQQIMEILKISQNELYNSTTLDYIKGLAYGQSKGDAFVLDAIAQFLSRQYGEPISTDNILVTSGASSGLFLILTFLVSSEFPVFVEEPGYCHAINTIKDDLQYNTIPIPMKKDGLNVTILRQNLESIFGRVVDGGRVEKEIDTFQGALYVVPTFHNPTGICYSEECCKEIIALSIQYNLLVICDDVYNCFYHAYPQHRLKKYDTNGTVVSNGTFSKIAAPGLRIGWIESSKKIVDFISEKALFNNGGCLNQLNSYLVAQTLNNGLLESHIAKCREDYKEKREWTMNYIKSRLKNTFSVTCDGGIFVWLMLPAEMNAEKLNNFCKSNYNVSFFCGSLYSPLNPTCFGNCVRLSLSVLEMDAFKMHVEKLVSAILEYDY